MRHLFTIALALCATISLSAQDYKADSVLLDAYLRQDMSVWKEYVDKHTTLLYEYGLCGYMVERDKPHALPYVKRFRQHVEQIQPNGHSVLPAGHYEMYLSAVYVYELRLHESMHPVKAMSLAKEAMQKAPGDPLVIAYYATCLFYAPKPFGSKQEALTYFEKADCLFRDEQWKFCWVREATKMYIAQCREKLSRTKQ